MVRSHLKIGDIFSVKIDDKRKMYFQYICNDLSQLNSNVIRAFKKDYPIKETPDLSEIINDEVYFYVHCIVKLGIKMKLWEKFGNSNNIGKTDDILFRDTEDAGAKIGEQVSVSFNWYVWKINGEPRRVGKLEGENKKAEIGLVVNPYNVVTRLRTGKYDFFYPGFEYTA